VRDFVQQLAKFVATFKAQFTVQQRNRCRLNVHILKGPLARLWKGCHGDRVEDVQVIAHHARHIGFGACALEDSPPSLEPVHGRDFTPDRTKVRASVLIGLGFLDFVENQQVIELDQCAVEHDWDEEVMVPWGTFPAGAVPGYSALMPASRNNFW
jgi:hypothetical protein